MVREVREVKGGRESRVRGGGAVSLLFLSILLLVCAFVGCACGVVYINLRAGFVVGIVPWLASLVRVGGMEVGDPSTWASKCEVMRGTLERLPKVLTPPVLDVARDQVPALGVSRTLPRL